MAPSALAIAVTRWTRILGARWSDFWSAPDPLLLGQGHTGEVTVAKMRILVLAMVLAFPVHEVRGTLLELGPLTAAAIMVSFGAVTIGMHRAAVVVRYSTKVGLGSTAIDVTLVSLALLGVQSVWGATAAVNSVSIFPIYFVAIIGTSMRYDPRISAFAGLLSILQYAGIVAWADSRLMFETVLGVDAFDLNAQYLRMGLLGAAGLFSVIAAVRIHHLRWLSAKDPLTGVLNRGTFDELAEMEIRRSERYKRQVSVVWFDVDNFKAFNDTYGHIVGDEILKGVAQMLRTVRRSDLVSRYGGEEFVLLLPETDKPGGVFKAEALRKVIETSSVTVSAGVATYPEDGDGLRSVMDIADRRLYQAKKAGRNRVIGGDVDLGVLSNRRRDVPPGEDRRQQSR